MTRNKYGVAAKHQRTVDGIVFDSKLEASRYSELRLMERAGVIRNLRRQVKFELVPAFTTTTGEKIRSVNYVCDFAYTERGGHEVVEDSKGARTPVFLLKRKLLLYRYPDIDFRETGARGKRNGKQKAFEVQDQF